MWVAGEDCGILEQPIYIKLWRSRKEDERPVKNCKVERKEEEQPDYQVINRRLQEGAREREAAWKIEGATRRIEYTYRAMSHEV